MINNIKQGERIKMSIIENNDLGIKLTSEPDQNVDNHTICHVCVYKMQVGLCFNKSVIPTTDLLRRGSTTYFMTPTKSTEPSSPHGIIEIGDELFQIDFTPSDKPSPIFVTGGIIFSMSPLHKNTQIHPIMTIHVYGKNQMEELLNIFENLWRCNQQIDAPLISIGKNFTSEFAFNNKNKGDIKYADTDFINTKQTRGSVPYNGASKKQRKKYKNV